MFPLFMLAGTPTLAQGGACKPLLGTLTVPLTPLMSLTAHSVSC